MSRPRLGKPQKQLVAIIEAEGGTVLASRKGANHIALDFTFDKNHVLTQHIPYGTSMSPRWASNFRSEVRKCKRKLLETPSG